MDVHHRGQVLFVRNIEDAIRVAALQTIVEDETGVAEKLALYNTEAAAKEDQLLPLHAVFAVKEPYYMVSPNGSYSIRVDHPSDLVHLIPLDPRIPNRSTVR